jgi:predicted HTH transcriptional regulator
MSVSYAPWRCGSFRVYLDLKRKHALERRIHQLARTRIKPAPPVEIVFEEIRGMTVSRISVARGEKPLYTLDNVVYLRRGSSDVQAQPDEIISLVTQFAFQDTGPGDFDF